MKRILLALTLALTGLLFAEEKPRREWTCSFAIKNNKIEQSNRGSKSKNNGNNYNTTKTTTSTSTWVGQGLVNVMGKGRPEKIEIIAYYIGESDGARTIVDTHKYPVTLDEKGRATVEMRSPTMTMTRTKTSGHRNNGSNSRSGGRILGAAFQLMADGELVKGKSLIPGYDQQIKKVPFKLER